MSRVAPAPPRPRDASSPPATPRSAPSSPPPATRGLQARPPPLVRVVRRPLRLVGTRRGAPDDIPSSRPRVRGRRVPALPRVHHLPLGRPGARPVPRRRPRGGPRPPGPPGVGSVDRAPRQKVLGPPRDDARALVRPGGGAPIPALEEAVLAGMRAGGVRRVLVPRKPPSVTPTCRPSPSPTAPPAPRRARPSPVGGYDPALGTSASTEAAPRPPTRPTETGSSP